MKKHIILLSVTGSLFIAGSAMAATYTVKKGDWLSTIAKNHGLTLKQIADLNPQITNLNLIEPGDIVNIGDRNGDTTKTTEKIKAEREVVKQQVTEEKQAAKETAKAVKEEAGKGKCAKCDNVINGNPLYRPAAGRFYSITTASTDTDFKTWGLGEEFGYGITDRLSVFLNLAGSTYKFDDFSFDMYGGGLSFRYLNDTNWKGDVYGKVAQLGVIDSVNNEFFAGAYQWTAGTKFGYATCGWTVNGLVEYDFTHIVGLGEAFDGLKTYKVGAEGQYVFTADWNVVGSVVYVMPDLSDFNYYTGKIGVNYNIDTTKYLGFYVFQELHDGDFADNTGLAIQFGIDF
jgi:murein DD-endopeptidase MepM/ murein hydrolase activator NlpD